MANQSSTTKKVADAAHTAVDKGKDVADTAFDKAKDIGSAVYDKAMTSPRPRWTRPTTRRRRPAAA